MTSTDWRVAAVRIGRSFDRRLGLLVGGASLDETTELAYYVWCLRQDDGTVVVVDAGFDSAAAERRGIVDYRPVPEALATVGVQADTVETVVLSHLHWDHAGQVRAFPNATFVVGRAEWAWTHSRARAGGAMFDELWDTTAIGQLEALDPGRVVLIDRARPLGRHSTARVVGGHTVGHVIVETHTGEGDPVVILSDLAYLQANIDRMAAPLICHDRWSTRDLYEELVTGGRRLFPGHDPALLDEGTKTTDHAAVW